MQLALYEKLVATNPEVKIKGAASAYTSRNGHMFSYLGKDGHLALRLPLEELEAFLIAYRTRRPVAYDTVMKEYVRVPKGLLKKTAELKPYFDMSWEYVGAKKPNPTTKKKATKKAAKKVSKKAVKTTAKKTKKRKATKG